ncbi:hypothetical protein Egran_06597 [Elaphomyces granulatus]|uniref:Amino acid permease/ SLC12A domain-containing protein n=1 Tax=Elaphomyces granulatus TaxID=519963 RepID=A0A232LNA6_9EURO|nr:hypothetical protein Egran_06597 [Elaphomyces granulatus]
MSDISKTPDVYRDLNHDPVASERDIPTISDHSMDADELALVALGYKQEFKREFSLWTIFSLSFAVLGLLPSFASTMAYGMGYAGTAGMVWGWIIAMLFIQCVAAAIAELCSSMPTSGGLYYAAAVLAPPGYGPFAAWLTGWSNWIGQISAAPSVDYSLAAMILAAVSVNNPSYVPARYQTFLLTTLILIVHTAISTMPTRWIAKINSYGSVVNILALFITIAAIPIGTLNVPKFNPSSQVWGDIYNGAEFPDGVAVLMSFVGVIWTMSGYDSAFHLSEECSNANVASPRAITMTATIGGIIGWFLQLVVAYTVRDIPSIMASSIAQPWASYLLQVMPQKTAMTILALTIICGFSTGQGCMVAASRVSYAYARDDCFPFSRIWKQVNPYTKTPVNAVIANGVLGILMCLLIFGGSTAIAALFSICAIAQYIAFTIPIAIRVFFVGNRFRRGPWHLGPFSRPIGGIGVMFVLLMLPILCLPMDIGSDLTAQGMNWTCLVYGAPMLAITIWWVIDARKWFKGPKVNIEHELYTSSTELHLPKL